jgi:hypothetical protein
VVVVIFHTYLLFGIVLKHKPDFKNKLVCIFIAALKCY